MHCRRLWLMWHLGRIRLVEAQAAAAEVAAPALAGAGAGAGAAAVRLGMPPPWALPTALPALISRAPLPVTSLPMRARPQPACTSGPHLLHVRLQAAAPQLRHRQPQEGSVQLHARLAHLAGAAGPVVSAAGALLLAARDARLTTEAGVAVAAPAQQPSTSCTRKAAVPPLALPSVRPGRP